LSKNYQLQSCSAINYRTNGINILAGDDPVPVKFWPKDTDPQHEGCMFHVSHGERYTVGVSRPCFTANNRRPYTRILSSHYFPGGTMQSDILRAAFLGAENSRLNLRRISNVYRSFRTRIITLIYYYLLLELRASRCPVHSAAQCRFFALWLPLQLN